MLVVAIPAYASGGVVNPIIRDYGRLFLRAETSSQTRYRINYVSKQLRDHRTSWRDLFTVRPYVGANRPKPARHLDWHGDKTIPVVIFVIKG